MKKYLYIFPFLFTLSCSNDDGTSFDSFNDDTSINKLIIDSFEDINIRLQKIEDDLNKLEQEIKNIDTENSSLIDDYVYDYDNYTPPPIQLMEGSYTSSTPSNKSLTTDVNKLTDIVSLRDHLNEIRTQNDQEYASDISNGISEANDDQDEFN